MPSERSCCWTLAASHQRVMMGKLLVAVAVAPLAASDARLLVSQQCQHIRFALTFAWWDTLVETDLSKGHLKRPYVLHLLIEQASHGGNS